MSVQSHASHSSQQSAENAQYDDEQLEEDMQVMNQGQTINLPHLPIEQPIEQNRPIEQDSHWGVHFVGMSPRPPRPPQIASEHSTTSEVSDRHGTSFFQRLFGVHPDPVDNKSEESEHTKEILGRRINLDTDYSQEEEKYPDISYSHLTEKRSKEAKQHPPYYEHFDQKGRDNLDAFRKKLKTDQETRRSRRKSQRKFRFPVLITFITIAIVGLISAIVFMSTGDN